MFWKEIDQKSFRDNLPCICANEILVTEMDQDQLVEGANRMLHVAKEVLASQTARQVNQLLLQDTDVTEHDEDAA